MIISFCRCKHTFCIRTAIIINKFRSVSQICGCNKVLKQRLLGAEGGGVVCPLPSPPPPDEAAGDRRKALLVQLSKCLVQFHFIVLLLQLHLLVIRFVPTLQETIQYSVVLICATICTQECFELVPHDAILLLSTRNRSASTNAGSFCILIVLWKWVTWHSTSVMGTRGDLSVQNTHIFVCMCVYEPAVLFPTTDTQSCTNWGLPAMVTKSKLK